MRTLIVVLIAAAVGCKESPPDYSDLVRENTHMRVAQHIEIDFSGQGDVVQPGVASRWCVRGWRMPRKDGRSYGHVLATVSLDGRPSPDSNVVPIIIVQNPGFCWQCFMLPENLQYQVRVSNYAEGLIESDITYPTDDPSLPIADWHDLGSPNCRSVTP